MFSIDEISKEPVDIKWYYQKEGEWYGTFTIDDKEYDVSFTREDKKFDIEFKTISFKFARPDRKDPFAFSFDFNKPLVVRNTIIKAIKDYLHTSHTELFVVKSYSKESSRVSKYRKFTNSLRHEFGFLLSDEKEFGEYTYFILYRSSKQFMKRHEILSKLINP